MNLKILSFAGKTIEIANAISLTIDTKMGQITVLNSHSPLIIALKPCVAYIKYFDENNMPKREDFAIGGGILEVA
jgi:F0F1-type ATP synthase epsilon subunit